MLGGQGRGALQGEKSQHTWDALTAMTCLRTKVCKPEDMLPSEGWKKNFLKLSQRS